jgi:hypothetical protein
MSSKSQPLKIVFLDRQTIPKHLSLKTIPFEHTFVSFDFTNAKLAAGVKLNSSAFSTILSAICGIRQSES